MVVHNNIKHTYFMRTKLNSLNKLSIFSQQKPNIYNFYIDLLKYKYLHAYNYISVQRYGNKQKVATCL